MNNYRDEMIGEVKKYCALSGLKRSYIASIIVNDARFFDRIEAGGTCTVDTYQKVMDWFKEKQSGANHNDKNKHVNKKVKKS